MAVGIPTGAAGAHKRAATLAAAMLAAATIFPATASAAPRTPESFGSHPVGTYHVRIPVPVDPRGPEGVFTELAANVYVPRGRGPWPVFQLSHAWPGTLREFPLSGWGRRLASRGFIVIVSDRRAASAAPDPSFDQLYDGQGLSTDVNSEDVLRVLRWAIAQNSAAGSFLRGRIDPRRLAVGGHSLGGYFATYAAVMSRTEGPHLSALVLLDPTDERLGGNTLRSSLAVARQVRAPSVVLASEANEHPIQCDMSNGTDCTIVSRQEYAALTGTTRYGLKVIGAVHEDVEDPRTAGPPSKPKQLRLFQRYGMAWLEYWLGRDCAASAYLGHGKAVADQRAGKIALYRQNTRIPGCSSHTSSKPKPKKKRRRRTQGEE